MKRDNSVVPSPVLTLERIREFPPLHIVDVGLVGCHEMAKLLKVVPNLAETVAKADQLIDVRHPILYVKGNGLEAPIAKKRFQSRTNR